MKKFLVGLFVLFFLFSHGKVMAGLSYGAFLLESDSYLFVSSGDKDVKLASYSVDFSEEMLVNDFSEDVFLSFDRLQMFCSGGDIGLDNPRLGYSSGDEFLGVVFGAGDTVFLDFDDLNLDVLDVGNLDVFVDVVGAGSNVVLECGYDFVMSIDVGEGFDDFRSFYYDDTELVLAVDLSTVSAEEVFDVREEHLVLPLAEEYLSSVNGIFDVYQLNVSLKPDFEGEVEIEDISFGCYDYWNDIDSYRVEMGGNLLEYMFWVDWDFSDELGKQVFDVRDVNGVLANSDEELSFKFGVGGGSRPLWYFECGLEDMKAFTDSGEQIVFSDAFLSDFVADFDKQTFFIDLNSGDKYYEAIIDGVRSGLISGYPDGTFQSEAFINRAEFLKMMLEAGFDDIPEVSETCFPDAVVGQWYNKYLCFAKERGIVSGYDNGEFRPSDRINIVESLKIVLETLKEDELEVFINGLSPMGEWYAVYVGFAEANGFYLSEWTDLDQHLLRREMAYLLSLIAI